MTFQIRSHTADLRIYISAETIPQLFLEGLKAIGKIQKRNWQNISNFKEIKKIFRLRSSDRNILLVDFLNAVLTESQISGVVFKRGIIRKLSQNEIVVEAFGLPVDKFDKDIKAISYHMVEIKRNKDKKWSAKLVADI